MKRFPSLFVSHGSPMILLEDCPARRFLADYGSALDRPEAILMVSAHWETGGVAVATTERPETVHDFFGFPRPFYDLRYAVPGAPGLAAKAADFLQAAGLAVGADPHQGLDHGAWVPLMFMFPAADVPVAQVSIQPHLGPAHHLALGRALGPLREDGVLVVGSGNVTHGLRELDRGGVDDPPYPWVAAFADWLASALEEGRAEDVVRYRAAAPEAARNHPSEDHFLPLLVALGAGGPDARAERVHASTAYRTLAMDAYAFD